ncbi:SUMF1/EgtB/PvdO family nonheme iron enzyme [Thiothrix fructosivorans]|uniref:SUMF1/EgtB/PvdO family nonheme iron enzyme n=1 Tax=Thiothrix fructosivorans TaxID=111770 RepID=A0A8B0SLK5_9GAMM|nr:SUMF1/EgtB/PvdO family nonheme iron enzyme [Thiothrix fructosivorans]MBO0615011.1 SUMF1/EgtB/PvdO family nonheme iron enzyme [Thiothrix fructosivorans]QTX09812.1 SUMF1/EgtB/PvdO family nonheme iron enzyme [Thiothrix fructosivorans]
MSHTPPVFISYPQDGAAGQALANELFQRLQAEGITAFLDTESIRLGERWIQALGNGVKQCRVVLSVVSSASHDRPWVEKEYIEANKLRIPIIPVLATAGDVPFQMNDVQVARLYGDYKEKDWQRLLARIREYLPDGNTDNDLETRVDAYLDWVQNTFLRDMDAYTAMDGKKRVRAQPQVRRKRFIVDEDFAELVGLRAGCGEKQVLEEKTFDNILDALGETGQGVFLGKPGAGKTTTLWKLADDEIRANAQRERGKRIVPVILRLGFWTKSDQLLLDFVLAQTNIEGQKLGDAFSTLLEQNRILLVLDGLNEMPVMWQKDKGRQIREFLAVNTLLRAYASCREDDYCDDVRQPLPELQIQPLSISRIQQFIHQYLVADQVEQAGQEAENLFWAIAGGQDVREVWALWEKVGATQEQFWTGTEIPQENPNVYGATTTKHDQIWQSKIRDNPHNLIRLARNPYLLAMLMAICEPGEAFPANRGALLAGFYRQLVKREIQRQQDKANLLQDGGKQLEALIGKLAWTMAEQTQTSSPRYETLSIMGHDEQWLKLAIRCNVLEQIGDNIRFSHQLLQDYFIAIGMQQRLDAGELPAEHFWQQTGEWWEPTGWEEPVVLLAGLYQDDCTSVIRWLEQANPKLAARCIGESGVPCVDVTKAHVQSLWVERLSNLETDPNPHARAAIGTALASVDMHGRPLDQRKGVGLDAKGLPDIDWVAIDGYKMSRYPVTNAQFQAFVADAGYETDEWWEGLQRSESKPDHYWKESNHPVEGVSWYDAMAFCRWLSTATGQEIRLPTEQEWEKAACGTDGREYPWGKDYKTGYANINETYGETGIYNLQKTSAVGIYPQGQSPYGLMDMSGNVWEWCLNKYKESQVTLDLSGCVRVVRGGAWYHYTESCRFSSDNRPPHDRYYDQGFRLLLRCC